MMQTWVRRGAAGTVVIAMAVAQGCYNYQPVAPTVAPKHGERVRVRLTPEGTAELARFLGPNVVVAEGELASADGQGTLMVAVDYVQQGNGVRQHWTGEGIVGIPATYRADVQERVLLRRQSVVAGMGLTVALVTTSIIALKAGGAQGGPGPGGTPPPP